MHSRRLLCVISFHELSIENAFFVNVEDTFFTELLKPNQSEISRDKATFLTVDAHTIGWITIIAADKTRSSADADNRRDAFSGQSRSTNMVPFWVRCDFSLSM